MNASVSSLTAPIARFLGKHHPIIFIMIVASLLSAAIMMLILIIQAPQSTTVEEISQARINNKFDQATIDRIENLHASSDSKSPSSIAMPSGRYNPFVE